MKKTLVIILLCLPFMAMAQVKPNIPISEVVRQAQAEIAQRKQNKSTESKKLNIRTHQQESASVYNPNDASCNSQSTSYSHAHHTSTRSPYINRATRTPKIPNLNAIEFNNQLDFSNEFGLSLSTNALMWVTATPNIDLRLQYDKFSIVASFGYASWNLPNHKFWWITSLGGELRYDIIPNVYVGLMYNWFNFNIKFGALGNQGITQSMGVVVGYKLPIGRKLALDFGLGLGYALVENEKYHEEGSVFVRQENRTFGYWGPIKAQVSLVWRIL